jgi:hypothetical protein
VVRLVESGPNLGNDLGDRQSASVPPLKFVHSGPKLLVLAEYIVKAGT